MNYFVVIIDSLFVFMASFVLTLCLLYYFLEYPTSLIMSICISLIVSIFTLKRLYSKRKRIKIENADKKEFGETMIRLNLMKQSKVLEIFKKACAKDATVIKHKDWFYCQNQNTAYFIRFGFAKVSKTDIVKAFNLIKSQDKAVFFAQSYESEVSEFASRFNGRIILKDGKDAFYLLKEVCLIPNEDYSKVYSEKKYFNKMLGLLKKKNAKKFFLFGVCFCLFSFIAPLKTYYLVWGGIMLIYSALLILFGKDEREN